MQYQGARARTTRHHYYGAPHAAANSNTIIACDWNVLCQQLLEQWSQLTMVELEQTYHNRNTLAKLIQRKCGVPTELAENYLRNFERTLPLLNGISSNILLFR